MKQLIATTFIVCALLASPAMAQDHHDDHHHRDHGHHHEHRHGHDHNHDHDHHG